MTSKNKTHFLLTFRFFRRGLKYFIVEVYVGIGKAGLLPIFLWYPFLSTLVTNPRKIYKDTENLMKLFQIFSKNASGALCIFDAKQLMEDLEKKVPIPRFDKNKVKKSFYLQRFWTNGPLCKIFPNGISCGWSDDIVCLRLRVPEHFQVDHFLDYFTVPQEKEKCTFQFLTTTLFEIKCIWERARTFGNRNLIDETLHCARNPISTEGRPKRKYCLTFANAWNSLTKLPNCQYSGCKQVVHDSSTGGGGTIILQTCNTQYLNFWIHFVKTV